MVVIDGNTNTVTARADVGPDPTAVAVNSTTHTVYVGSTQPVSVIAREANPPFGLQILGEATALPGTRRGPASAIASLTAVSVAILLVCLR